MARLGRRLGRPAVEAAWRQVTGQAVPQAVRDYLVSHRDDSRPAGTP